MAGSKSTHRVPARTEKISISKFKANALRLLAQVKATGRSLSVTKRGIVIAHIVPPLEEESPRLSAGVLKGTVLQEGDLITPLDINDWNVL